MVDKGIGRTGVGLLLIRLFHSERPERDLKYIDIGAETQAK